MHLFIELWTPDKLSYYVVPFLSYIHVGVASSLGRGTHTHLVFSALFTVYGICTYDHTRSRPHKDKRADLVCIHENMCIVPIRVLTAVCAVLDDDGGGSSPGNLLAGLILLLLLHEGTQPEHGRTHDSAAFRENQVSATRQ